ncbi:MAG: hypothetical protein K0U36_03445, partial [Alphaproteobacteria bacterium]|nr:hypothetical protein [Alphaproteobacteria bacterium]
INVADAFADRESDAISLILDPDGAGAKGQSLDLGHGIVAAITIIDNQEYVTVQGTPEIDGLSADQTISFTLQGWSNNVTADFAMELTIDNVNDAPASIVSQPILAVVESTALATQAPAARTIDLNTLFADGDGDA